jgi:tRNA(Ile)-lysidine synthase
MQEILKTLKGFLIQNHKPNHPVLLAYSGGGDSKALLYGLLELKNQFSLDLHLAHIDHNWRSSSFSEAQMLKKEAEDLNIPFHLQTLPKMAANNIEEKCRELRFLFFQELFQKYSFQALILAHQRDDVSETVLKRFLEGADFFSIKAMEEVTYQRGVTIWRPLLRFAKKELLDFLQKKHLTAIDDPTNYDPKYQRSNMRVNIIPDLEQQFGKQISNNLYIASLRSQEINSYLLKNTNKYFDEKVEGPFGIYLVFSNFIDMDELEKRFLIKRLGSYLKLDLSRSTVDRIIASLKGSFSLQVKGCKIITYRNILFFLTKEPEFKEKILLSEGKHTLENWEIEVSRVKDIDIKIPSWKDLWKGGTTIYLPLDKYLLIRPMGSMSYSKKKLSKWFSENEVPVFLRFCFPVIFKEDNMIYEFLSGKKRIKAFATEHYKISFKLTCLN